MLMDMDIIKRKINTQLYIFITKNKCSLFRNMCDVNSNLYKQKKFSLFFFFSFFNCFKNSLFSFNIHILFDYVVYTTNYI